MGLSAALICMHRPRYINRPPRARARAAAKASFFIDGLAEHMINNLTLENVTMGQATGKEVRFDYPDCTCDALTSLNRGWHPGRRCMTLQIVVSHTDQRL